MVRAKGDPVAVIGAAGCAGGLAIVAPAATACALAAALVVVARLGRPVTAAIAALAFAVGAARARYAMAEHERAASAVRSASWPARVVIAGTVARSPSFAGDALRVDLDVADLRARVRLHVPYEEGVELVRGDRVEAIADLAPPDRFANEGAVDVRVTGAKSGVVLSGGAHSVTVVARGSGVLPAIDRARAAIRGRIEATYPPPARSLARALVLGEQDVAPEDRRAFSRSGLAHLLAVSGMHLVVVVATFVAAARAVLVRIPAIAARCDARAMAATAALPLVWAYADLAGGSGSAVRAAWMTSAALVAHAVGRRPDAWRAAGLSALAFGVAEPLAAFDLSFVLSALATCGILALAAPIEEAVAERFYRKRDGAARPMTAFVTKAAAATVAATLPCAPVIATMSPHFPALGVVANVVAVPVGELAALPLSLAHTIAWRWPAAERGCATAAAGALLSVRALARAFAAASVHVPSPTSAELATLVIGTAAFFGVRRSRRVRVVAATLVALVALEVLASRRGAPRRVLRATIADVGQGDAALVDLPDGTAMLVDGGGLVGSPVDVGERALVPLLRARRRSRIDVVVLSHPHPDHFLGLASALEDVEVGALWDTGQGEAEAMGGAYGALLATMRARGVPILRPHDLCGTRIVGGAVVDVLAPCPEVSGDHGPNDNSFVLRLRYGERAILFAGDAERFEEEILVATGASSLRADVLKVGHHGSRTSSSPAFVAAVHPRFAVISCGVRNRFGHPHPAALAALAAAGSRVFRTDRDGSVVVTTDGDELEVETAR